MTRTAFLFLIILQFLFIQVTGQTSPADSIPQTIAVKDSISKVKIGFPVLLEEDTLFIIYKSLGPFTAEERAQRTTNKLEELFNRETMDSAAFHIEEFSGVSVLKYENISIGSITSEDARQLNMSQEELAWQYLLRLQRASLDYHEKEIWFKKLIRIGLLILTIIVFFFMIKFLNRGFNFLILKALQEKSGFLKGVKIKNYEFISAHKEKWIILQGLKILKWVIIFFLFSLTLPTLFSIFPATENLATTIFSHILNPLKRFGNAILEYIPNLFTIAIIILLTNYTTKLLYFLSTEVEKGKLEITGFFPEWSRPTFNLLRVIVWAFAFIAIFPYLPGSDSPIFQGVSVFLGLLISLGSSTAIGNIIAGLVITYMRAFKIGDRVKIGDTTGDVIEKTMLVTKVRTIKNEEVSIPNAAILTGSTINYTSNAGEIGLVLHSSVTIGYDVPWRKVHELLINAAGKTELLQKDPSPFVLQKALNDFSVHYEINAYTDQPNFSAKILSDLHQNIQDVFNEANIEILSPVYSSIRDGNQSTTPKENLSSGYKKPGFDINLKDLNTGKKF